MSVQTDFLRAFTREIIATYRINQQNPKKEVINADFIPSIAEELFKQRNLVERRIQTKPFPVPQKVQPQKPNTPQKFTAPAPPDLVPSTGEYGKITYLLKDPTVTIIECQGEGQPVSIFRAGLRQTTKITLSNSEIKDVLKKVAEKAHIPLIEGVFKAAVDNFFINAVLSSVISSKFVIKKQTPYSLITPQF